MSEQSNAITINAGTHNTAVLVLMHGQFIWNKSLQTIGEAFAAVMPHMKIILPRSPCVDTRPDGIMVPAWIKVGGTPDTPNWEDFKSNRGPLKSIATIIADEVRAGIPRSRIVLGGFSNGTVPAVWAALDQSQAQRDFCCMAQEPMAGVLLMSDVINMISAGANFTPIPQSLTKTSVLILQGTADTMYGVNKTPKDNAFNMLCDAGYGDVEVKQIEGMTHSFKGYNEFLREAGMLWLARDENDIGVEEAFDHAVKWLSRVVPNN